MRRIFLLSVILFCTFIQCKKPSEKVKFVPGVATIAVSSITINSAISGGSITSNGGAGIISKGLVWSTGSNPTILLTTKIIDTTTSISYSSKITGLAENTIYHIRAFATNSIGTGYGDELTFKTTSIVLPTFSDSLLIIDSITDKMATAHVPSLKSEGGSPISAKGIAWSTNANPDISSPGKTSNGLGTAGFSTGITGLSANTTYYVRAYATNSAGTSYGKEVSFKTILNGLPPVSDTIDVFYINKNSARVYIGAVKVDGTAPIISRGVVWSTNQNPLIDLSTKSSSTEMGWIDFNLTGLVSKQIYYVREFATNSVGTRYG
ncbi:MAG: hypothetical protein ABI266_05435, partial [Ginsengibacter sp.]